MFPGSSACSHMQMYLRINLWLPVPSYLLRHINFRKRLIFLFWRHRLFCTFSIPKLQLWVDQVVICEWTIPGQDVGPNPTLSLLANAAAPLENVLHHEGWGQAQRSFLGKGAFVPSARMVLVKPVTAISLVHVWVDLGRWIKTWKVDSNQLHLCHLYHPLVLPSFLSIPPPRFIPPLPASLLHPPHPRADSPVLGAVEGWLQGCHHRLQRWPYSSQWRATFAMAVMLFIITGMLVPVA